VTEQPGTPEPPAEPSETSARRARLRLDDVELVPEQTSDDTDAGWGRGAAPGDKAAELRRYLDEKPPHHGD